MKKWLFAFLLVLVSGGSSSDGLEHYVQFPPYTGQDLTIGIVGEIPEVREKTIHFVRIELEDLQDLPGLDGILISKSHLKEASEPQYARIYEEASIPFIFIESEKVILAFIEDDVLYENALPLRSGDYLIGIANHNRTHFGLGLYNGIENQRTIMDCYTMLFTMLDGFKATGEVKFDF